MSKMAAAAGPSTDPPPEIDMGSRLSGSPGTRTVGVPPGCGVGPEGAVVVVADTLAIPPLITFSWFTGGRVVVAVVAFLTVVLAVAFTVVVTPAAVVAELAA